MKTYRISKFSSVESIGKNQFVVWNDVSGLPIYENDDEIPLIKKFKNWQSAKVAAIEICQFYQSIYSRK